MSVWIELMCDVRKDGQNPRDITQARCYTNRNESVGGLARTPTATPAVIRQLIKEARKQGWIIAYGKIVCPGCRA